MDGEGGGWIYKSARRRHRNGEEEKGECFCFKSGQTLAGTKAALEQHEFEISLLAASRLFEPRGIFVIETDSLEFSAQIC